ncbi:MAG: LPD5 domain-containing protein, partial [Gallionella sp.]
AAKAKKLEVTKAQAKGKVTGDQAAALKELADAGDHAAVDEVLSPAQAPIEDFGEKIIGARKEYAAAYKDRMAEAKTMDVLAQPLSKSWPEPDYQKLVDSGYDKNIVGLVRSMRDEIPNKPGKEWKQKTWAKQVETLRDTADQLLNDKEFADRFISGMKKVEHLKLEDAINGRAELYAELGHEKSLKGIRISRSQYGVYNGVPHNPPKIIWEVTKDSKATAFGNMPRTLGSGDTRQAAIDAFAKAYSTLDTSKEKSSKTKFEIYADRYAKAGDKGQYFIGKKVGRNVLHIKDGIDSVKEAREYISSNNEELTAILEKKKEVPNERYDINKPRVGQDMRNGQDVTPQMFSDAFGFRGVQFGNYVEGARRQKDLNDAYDALMDLAAVLDIPPKAISLNGELGLAFGARGTGGKNPHSAHYESGHVVINLTKGSGAGSLAHEWWHSLDNYFSRMSGKKDEYTTDRRDVSLAARDSEYQFKDDGIRKEMIDAFGSVVKAINGTAIKQRSSSLDARRTKEYWGTGIEMSARAFERYVIAKLHDNGFANDYLANVVSEEYWNSAEALGIGEGGSYPYPTESELPAIRGGFDNFFQTIESKETDKGTALFSRAKAKDQNPQTAASVKQATQSLRNRWLGFRNVKIVQSVDEVPNEIYLRALRALKPINHTSEGFYDPKTNSVYLIADNLASPERAVWVAIHEVVGHGGIRMLDRKLADTLDMAGKNSTVQKLSRAIAVDRGEKYNATEHLDEAIAELAAAHVTGQYDTLFKRYSVEVPAYMRGNIRGVIQQIVDALRAFIARAMGKKQTAEEVSDKDILDLIKQMQRAVAGQEMQADDSGMVMASRSMSNKAIHPGEIAYDTETIEQPSMMLDSANRKGRTGFAIPKETSAQEIQRKHQDSLNRIKIIQDAIQEQGGVVDEKSNVYQAMERSTGRIGEMQKLFTDTVVEPLMKRVAELDTTTEEIGTYLMALGAKDRNAYIQTKREDMPSNGSGMSDDEAQEIIDDYKRRDNFAEFDKLARAIQKVTESKVDLLVRGRVMTAEQAKDMRAAMGFYVPFKGFEVIDESGNKVGNGIGGGYSTSKRVSRQAMGRISRAGQVVENIFRDYHAAVFLAEKANVGESLHKLVTDNPDPTLWTIARPEKTPIIVNGKVQIRDMGYDNTKEVRYIRNGEEFRIQLHDPLMVSAYNNLNASQLGGVLEASANMNTFLRQMYTQKNPEFILTNFFRDMQTAALVLTGEGGIGFAAKAMKHVPGAAKAMFAHAKDGKTGGIWDKYYDLARRNGALTAFAMLDDIETQQLKLDAMIGKYGGGGVVKAWKQGLSVKGTVLDKSGAAVSNTGKVILYRALDSAPMMLIENLNHAAENSYRMAAFRAYIDAHGGLNNVTPKVLAEASRISKNVTVNFNRKGEQSSAWNAAYLFWNANVQGTQNIYSASTQTEHKRQVQIIMAGLFTLGIFASMLTGDDDDELTSEYDKEHNLVLHVGETIIKMVLAYGLGFFFGAGYTVGNVFKGRESIGKGAVKILGQALDHFTPVGSPIHDGKVSTKDVLVAVAPTMLSPLVMSATNTNSHGGKLVPHYSDDDGKLDRETMYRGTRGTLYDKAANSTMLKWADVSPETLKMMGGFLTGGSGTFISNTYATVKEALSGEIPDVEHTPFFRKVISTKDVEEYRARFYTQLESIKEIASENELKQAQVLGTSINKWQKAMKTFREREEKARAEGNKSYIKLIENEQIGLAKKLNERYHAAMKKFERRTR